MKKKNELEIIAENIKRDFTIDEIMDISFSNLLHIMMFELNKLNDEELFEAEMEARMHNEWARIGSFSKFINNSIGICALLISLVSLLSSVVNINIPSFIMGIGGTLIIVLFLGGPMLRDSDKSELYYIVKIKCIERIYEKRKD